MSERIPTSQLLAAVSIAVVVTFGTVAYFSFVAPHTSPASASPVSIVSFQLNQSLTPAGPGVILVLENSGSSPITRLSASLELQSSYMLVFSNVSEVSPLTPGQSTSASGILFGASVTCGSIYPWNISGTFSYGSEFGFQTNASLSCA